MKAVLVWATATAGSFDLGRVFHALIVPHELLLDVIGRAGALVDPRQHLVSLLELLDLAVELLLSLAALSRGSGLLLLLVPFVGCRLVDNGGQVLFVALIALLDF